MLFSINPILCVVLSVVSILPTVKENLLSSGWLQVRFIALLHYSRYFHMIPSFGDGNNPDVLLSGESSC